MRPTTFKTSIDIAGYDCEATITYVIHPGFPGSREEPPEGATVEVTDITITTSADKRWAPQCLGTEARVKEIPDWLFETLAEEFEDEILETHDDGDDGLGDYLRDLQIDRELMEGR